MADDKNPASKKIQLPGSGNNESGFPAERNLLVVFALMMVTLLASPFFTTQPPAKKADPPKTTEAPAPIPPPTPGVATPKAGVAPAAPAAALQGAKPESFSLETPLYKIVFSNTGGTITSLQLRKFKDSKFKPLELINTRALAKLDAPFSLAIPKAQDLTYVNKKTFAHTMAPAGDGIDFEFADAKVRVKKSFRVSQTDYRLQVSSEVISGGAAVPHNLLWRGGFGDHAAFNASSFQHTNRFDMTENRLILNEAKEAVENQPKVDNGTYAFLGIDDTYFAAAFVPASPQALELRTYVDTVPNYDGVDAPMIGVSAGGSGRNDFTVYVGPKDVDLLKQVSPRLEQLIDWGRWFGWMARPMFTVMKGFHDFVKQRVPEGSWGWAIVLITIIINFLMLPFKFTSLRSAKKMAALKPEMDAINKKYAGIPMSDPRSQKKNEETMALYTKHKINPASGCIPLMVQLPFLIALYTVLTVTIDVRQSKWLWVNDLSQPEDLAIRILPLLMIASQFILQKMTPTAGMDPAQARMMLLMPLMFGFMFYGQSSGLVLYWLVGNLVALAQQWAFNKFMK